MYKAAQLTFSQRQMNELVDFKSHKGHELSYLYRGISQSQSYAQDVSYAVGVMALADIALFGVQASVVAKHLGEFINGALIPFALNPELWQFSLPEDRVDHARGWLLEGSLYDRKLRIQSLLNIHEQRARRYLCISRGKVCSTTDDITVTGERTMVMVDAVALAEEARACRPGALFDLQLEGAV
jgi:hypothetical protein